MSACTRMIGGHDAAIIAGGHTHIRMLRAHRGREIVNPGSVGLAYQFFPDGSVRVRRGPSSPCCRRQTPEW